ncbi:RNF4 ligase, partial [Hippolais icterina]|nr:RNF4 ligase [Hippolais icterina]
EDVIVLPGPSSEPEVITISDDESAEEREQSQQQPHLFRASENSAKPVARDDEEEPREDDGYVTDKLTLQQLHVPSASFPSSAQTGVVIRCPICMDFYPEIMRRGRQLMSTLCGHVFCSRCLPIALETAHMCPTCRVILSPELYHPIYL